MRDVEFVEQPLRGGDLVGFLLDIDVGQDQTGPGVECVQQLGRFAIAEIIEAAPQRLAVERDATSRRIGCLAGQSGCVQAENLLDGLRIEALEDVANGGMGGRTLPAQPEGCVQPDAMDLDEGCDGSKGVPAGDHGEDREQQDMVQLVEHALGPPRVGDFAELAEQMVERLQGNLLAGWVAVHRFGDFAAPESCFFAFGTIVGMCCVPDSPFPGTSIKR